MFFPELWCWQTDLFKSGVVFGNVVLSLLLEKKCDGDLPITSIIVSLYIITDKYGSLDLYSLYSSFCMSILLRIYWRTCFMYKTIFLRKFCETWTWKLRSIIRKNFIRKPYLENWLFKYIIVFSLDMLSYLAILGHELNLPIDNKSLLPLKWNKSTLILDHGLSGISVFMSGSFGFLL